MWHAMLLVRAAVFLCAVLIVDAWAPTVATPGAHAPAVVKQAVTCAGQGSADWRTVCNGKLISANGGYQVSGMAHQPGGIVAVRLTGFGARRRDRRGRRGLRGRRSSRCIRSGGCSWFSHGSSVPCWLKFLTEGPACSDPLFESALP